MAEDLPSPELLKELIERLDLLERVLGSNTARLHLIEQQLSISRQPPQVIKPVVGDNGETHPATSEVTKPDLSIPPAISPAPIASQPPKPPEETWPQLPPEQTWSRPGLQPPPAAETPPAETPPAETPPPGETPPAPPGGPSTGPG